MGSAAAAGVPSFDAWPSMEDLAIDTSSEWKIDDDGDSFVEKPHLQLDLLQSLFVLDGLSGLFVEGGDALRVVEIPTLQGFAPLPTTSSHLLLASLALTSLIYAATVLILGPTTSCGHRKGFLAPRLQLTVSTPTPTPTNL